MQALPLVNWHGLQPRLGIWILRQKNLSLLLLALLRAARIALGSMLKAAIIAGATREEISETIGMCVYMGGSPSLMYGAKALAAFDQFAEPKE